MRRQSALHKTQFSPSLLKILKLTIALLAPVLLISIGFFAYTFIQAEQNTRHRVDSILDQQTKIVDDTLNHINNFMMQTLVSNSDILDIRSAQSRNNEYHAVRQLRSSLLTPRFFMGSSINFYFTFPDKQVSFNYYNETNNYIQNEAVKSTLHTGIAEGNYDVNDARWHCIAIEDNLYLVQVYHYQGMYFCCWFDIDQLFAYADSVLMSEEGFFTLISAEGQPLSNIDDFEHAQITIQNDQITHRRQMVCYMESMKYANVRLLVADRQTLQYGDFGVYLLLMISILLVVIGFCSYTIHYFRQYIEKPLQSFQQDVNSFAKEQNLARSHGFAELNQAAASFSSLSQQLESLKIDIYEERIARARTELEYFQLQIKPHFFVNCFSIIFSMAQNRQYENIQDLCLKLSGYVRYIFVNSFDTIPLQEELNHIREYLDIQNIRFRTTMLVAFSNQENRDCLIPPLTLLTLTENSVKHNKVRKKDLVITIQAEKLQKDGRSWLRLIQSDNGIGLDQPALKNLNNIEPESNTHIGITNIRHRLQLLYAKDYSIRFRNASSGGCEAEIVIPWQEKKTI